MNDIVESARPDNGRNKLIKFSVPDKPSRYNTPHRPHAHRAVVQGLSDPKWQELIAVLFDKAEYLVSCRLVLNHRPLITGRIEHAVTKEGVEDDLVEEGHFDWYLSQSTFTNM